MLYIHILVFIAVFVIGTYFIRLVQAIGLEKIELEKSGHEGLAVKNPMDRYISSSNLLQMRIIFALIGAGLIMGIMLFAKASVIAILVLGVIFAALGFFLPIWYYMYKLARRKEEFEASILDLTMGLANGLKAGQGLQQSLEAVVSHLEGPIREELKVVLREYRLGVELPEALERLYKRMPCEDLRLLVTSVRLTTKSGGSLADVLARMTDMIRERTEFNQKLKTLTAQGRFEAIAIASAPLVVFVILYFMDRELMAPMLTSPIGWLAFGVVAVLETVGFLIINKIVTIEV